MAKKLQQCVLDITYAKQQRLLEETIRTVEAKTVKNPPTVIPAELLNSQRPSRLKFKCSKASALESNMMRFFKENECTLWIQSIRLTDGLIQFLQQKSLARKS